MSDHTKDPATEADEATPRPSLQQPGSQTSSPLPAPAQDAPPASPKRTRTVDEDAPYVDEDDQSIDEDDLYIEGDEDAFVSRYEAASLGPTPALATGPNTANAANPPVSRPLVSGQPAMASNTNFVPQYIPPNQWRYARACMVCGYIMVRSVCFFSFVLSFFAICLRPRPLCTHLFPFDDDDNPHSLRTRQC